MKKTTFFKMMLLAIVMMGASISVNAQSLYEGFNYTIGDNIGGNATTTSGGPNNNWYFQSNTSGISGTINIVSGNLSYPGLAASTGNKISLPGSNTTVPRDVNTAITGTGANVAYYSVLINVTDNTQLNTTGDYFFGFGGTTGTTLTIYGARLFIKSVNAGANYRLLILNTSGGTTTTTEYTTDLNFGTTYLVVVKYDKSASPTVASLWVNPTLGGSEPSGSVQNSSGTGAFAAFASVFIRNATGTPKVDIDEIRVGTTWASVTPLAPAISVVESSVPNMSVDVPSRTLTVSGTNLTGDITLAISGTNAAQFDVNPKTLTQTAGAVSSASVTISYTNGSASDAAVLTLSSPGATSKTFNLAGGITTGISQVAQNLSVSVSDGSISFNSEAGKTVELYNAVGQKLLMKQTNAGLNSLAVTAKGLLVVKIGNQIAKVLM